MPNLEFYIRNKEFSEITNAVKKWVKIWKGINTKVYKKKLASNQP